jgi:hypothetical protein
MFNFISIHVLTAVFVQIEVFWVVSISCLFNDAVSISDYTAHVAKLWFASRMTVY